jgi:hypothetical protein
MPKYRLVFDFGEGRERSLGTIVHKDDDDAIAAFARLVLDGAGAELWRPDRKRLLARRTSDGTMILAPQP